MHINKSYISHEQNEGQKSYDHIKYAEKVFHKIQHSFMIKTLSQLGIEEMYLNIQNSVVLLYTSSKLFKKEIKRITEFTIASK